MVKMNPFYKGVYAFIVVMLGSMLGATGRAYGDGHEFVGTITEGLENPTYVTGNQDNLFVYDASKKTVEKYDQNGSHIGSMPVNNSGTLYKANGIASDPTGNLYLTGKTLSSGGGYDFATIKYGPDGKQAWVNYSSAGNSPTDTTGIAVDSQGYAYVTGQTTTGGDFATIKYDSTGKQNWVQKHSGSTWNRYAVKPTGVAVDSQGNLYVNGESQGAPSSWEFTTVKYDSSGKLVWVKHNSTAKGNAFSINNKTGNYYAVDSGSSSNPLIRYYDRNLNPLGTWDKVSGSYPFSNPTSIYVAESGKVYIADSGAKTVEVFNAGGTNETAGTSQIPWYPGSPFTPSGVNQPTLISGNQECLYVLDALQQKIVPYLYCGSPAPGVTSIPVGNSSNPNQWRGIAVDSTGSAYLTGQLNESGSMTDFATVKYDSTGKQIWVQRYNGPAKNVDYPSGIAVDSSGNAYVSGTSTSETTSGQWDFSTVKYDSTGKYLWSKRYNGPAKSSNTPVGIAVDSQGNAYVTGDALKSDSATDFATVKYDSSGKQLWVKRYSGPSGNGVAVDNNTGTITIYVDNAASVPPFGAIDFYDFSGNPLGSVYTGYDGQSYTSLGNIYYGPTGTLYITEPGKNCIQTRFNTPQKITTQSVPPKYAYSKKIQTGLLGPRGVTGDSEYLYILDASYRSIYKYYYTGSPVTSFPGITLSDSTNMYNFDGVGVGPNGYIYYTNTSGHQIWKFNALGGLVTTWSTGSGSYPKGITIDSQGYLYVSNPGTHHIVKYDSTGVIQSNFNPTTSVYSPNGVAVDSSGYLYVTGGENSRSIYKYNPTGSNLLTLVTGTSTNQFQGIAVDSSGNFYTVDTGSSTPNVKIYKSDGTLYQTVETGSGNTPLENPWGVFLSEQGNLYVANDAAQGGVFVYEPDTSYIPTPVPSTNTPTFIPTATPTKTPFIFPSKTPTKTPTSPALPTDTPTIPPSPTLTLVPPTNTPDPNIPTSTPTPTSTDTPVPPTNTPLGGAYRWYKTISYTGAVDPNSRLNQPSEIVYEYPGILYVLDQATNSVHKFETNGTHAAQSSISIGSQRRIYISQQDPNACAMLDPSTGRVTIHTYPGMSESVTREFTLQGFSEANITSMGGAAADSAGNLYISDTGNNRILKYDSQGILLGQWGTLGTGDTQFNSPGSLSVDSTGNLYVADEGNHTVKMYDPNGTYQQQFGSSTQLKSMKGIAVDSSGNVYAVEMQQGSQGVHIFSNAGKYVTRYNGEGLLQQPWGVAVDHLGYLYVTNYNANTKIGNVISYRPATAPLPMNTPAQVTSTPVPTSTNTSTPVPTPTPIITPSFTPNPASPYTWYKTITHAGIKKQSLSFYSKAQTLQTGFPSVASYNSTTQKFTWFSNQSGELVYGGAYTSNYQTTSDAASLGTDVLQNFYLLDRGSTRVITYDPLGKVLTSWGSWGTGDEQFSLPWGLAVDSSGNVYVSDTSNARIQKFNKDGVFQSKIVSGLSNGSNGPIPFTPNLLTVSWPGTLYVVDEGSRDVKSFDSSGNYLTTYSQPSQIHSPKGVAVDSTGNVYVVESDENSPGIHIFTSTGAYVTRYDGDGFLKSPYLICVDNNGYLYVSDHDPMKQEASIHTFRPKSIAPAATATPAPSPTSTAVPTLAPTATATPTKVAGTAFFISDNLGDSGEVSDGVDHDADKNRSMVLRWNLAGGNIDPNNIKDIQVYVLVDQESKYVYFGRTGDGSSQVYEWKSGSPRIAPPFQKGPQFGHTYRFRIYPMTISGEPKFFGPFTSNGSVTLLPYPIVTDDPAATDDLSNGIDRDTVTKRALTIRWTIDPTDMDLSIVKDYHVYVQTDKIGKYVYLGRAGSGTASSFLWSKGSPRIAAAFTDGPQFGHFYAFRLYAMKTTGTPAFYGPFSSVGPVEFLQE